MQRRFDGWSAVHDKIAETHRSIEFRREGTIAYNLFYRSFGREKAVDVKLATDLLMLRDIYDVAVIVSGDQDYVPAVQVAKDCGKQVVNVAFMTRSHRLLPGGARRLNQRTDWSLTVEYEPFRKFLKLDKASR
ncbi:MAG: NYN domain-containing protein [Phycisphaerae bacterium]|nr:NYN domain-containing protein [Phycisphaerae bacterium]